MAIALRVDVDTVRGTRDGIPRLLSILERHGVRATWYLTLGPDNMGRHAWRLLRPAFFMKMMRSQAASLYGYDILFRGTLWPGTVISRHFKEQLRMPGKAGQEVGVHAWDHHRWQVGIDALTDSALEAQLNLACDAFEQVIGREPESAAAPGWRCSERVLGFARSRRFRFRSDCRGPARPFRPRVDGAALDQPQIPVDLPTYDEAALPREGRDEAWNERLLGLISDGKPHVLTVHAESEGGAKSACFDDFLGRSLAAGHRFTPLSSMLPAEASFLESGTIGPGSIPGREGWVCVRTDTLQRT
ncbi:MAG: 4-deoxy-4-formamido-L-arabinose-phosphoundecaprenol deformylase [Planctomycetes bacterium]|nr:4-deoxy-4-formamido-L-arabinose-phosphoundecaprenol deformylase [Planctomycetota bacterium]